MTYKQIAYLWETEFSEAINRGSAKGIAEVSNVLFEKAKNGDTAAAIFYLKCRTGWDKKNYGYMPISPDEGKCINTVNPENVITALGQKFIAMGKLKVNE